jgi:acetyl-CoA carboxylase / biotin carboxylase 1
MVSWEMTLRTPAYPAGRKIILIANDISVKAGSFGVAEDKVFNLASVRAREKKLPRLYFSVNSGARIGLALELKYKFKVAWNQNDVTKGPSYLYLSATDYADLKSSVKAEKLTVKSASGEEVRYKITDIIGADDGLGVENLSGSGLIAGSHADLYPSRHCILLGIASFSASHLTFPHSLLSGETSKAYKEVFTLTYCCGRSVGIGAYLARLGQRVVQVRPT